MDSGLLAGIYRGSLRREPSPYRVRSLTRELATPASHLRKWLILARKTGMSKIKSKPTMTDTLKAEIEQSGTSRCQIAQLLSAKVLLWMPYRVDLK